MTRDDIPSLVNLRKHVSLVLGVSDYSSLHPDQQMLVDQAIDAEVGLLAWRIARRVLGNNDVEREA